MKDEIYNKMEHIKRRKLECGGGAGAGAGAGEEEILEKQNEMLAYILQIGQICESSFHMIHGLQKQVDRLGASIEKFEKITQELKKRDAEIATLKELHENMIQDYEKRIQMYENKTETKANDYSFYS